MAQFKSEVGNSTDIDFDDIVYLRPEIKLEPLVCGWYAWSHLISPIQHAMNVTFRHLPLLQSFIQNPKVHESATREPAMFGGPFVHLSSAQVPAVRQLVSETATRSSQLIKLANDIRALDERLQNTATGYSLSDFYRHSPSSLVGMVEFLYDINDHPKLRFQEELLFDENLCSDTYEIMLSASPENDRRFFMSTPRMKAGDNLIFKMQFSDERLDMLSSMRTDARKIRVVKEDMGVTTEEWPIFKLFFTRDPPDRKHANYGGNAVRVRYFGHACVLIQTAQVSILIDPMLAWDPDKDGQRFTFVDLPDRIDYVVLSHNHQDHCSPEMLIQLRHRIDNVIVPRNNSGSISDPSMKLALGHLGFKNVHVVDSFDEISIPDGVIKSLPFPGEHVDLDIHTRHGIYIQILGRNFAFLVDSDGCDPMLFTKVARRIGRNLDALFLGMECHGAPLTWLYGPLLTKQISRRDDESRRLSGLNSERAWKVIQELATDRVFTYAMGQEPWLKYIMGLQYSEDSVQLKELSAFLARCKDAGIKADNLFMKAEYEFTRVASCEFA